MGSGRPRQPGGRGFDASLVSSRASSRSRTATRRRSAASALSSAASLSRRAASAKSSARVCPASREARSRSWLARTARREASEVRVSASRSWEAAWSKSRSALSRSVTGRSGGGLGPRSHALAGAEERTKHEARVRARAARERSLGMGSSLRPWMRIDLPTPKVLQESRQGLGVFHPPMSVTRRSASGGPQLPGS